MRRWQSYIYNSVQHANLIYGMQYCIDIAKQELHGHADLFSEHVTTTATATATAIATATATVTSYYYYYYCYVYYYTSTTLIFKHMHTKNCMNL